MADLKISQLTGATTPLAGTEVLPIVQSSSTVKVSVDNLTKGRTVNATTFDTDVAAAGVTLSGTTLAADGTDAAINVNITPKGAGVVQTTAPDAIVKFRVNTANSGVSASNYSQAELADVGNVRTFWRSVRDGSGKTVFAYNDHLSVWANGATEVWRFTLDGNLAQYTAAKGVNFTANTPAAGMTSQLLNWYEEGTWTPTDDSGAGLAFTNVHGFYTRVGDIVTAFGRVTFPTTASMLTITIGGLPFVVANNAQPGGGFIRLTNSGRNDTVVASATTSQILFYDTNINAAVNSNYSGNRVDWVVIYKI